MHPKREETRNGWPLTVLWIILAMIFLGLSAASIIRNRVTYIKQSTTKSKAQAQLLGENTAGMLYTVDYFLLSVASMVQHESAYGATITPSALLALVRKESRILPQIENVVFLDAQGNVAASDEPVDEFRLANFAEYRDAWLGTAVETRFTEKNEVSIRLSRRLESHTGEFLGVLVAVIDAAFFYDRYNDYLNIDADAILLFDNDGRVLSNWYESTVFRMVAVGANIDALPGFPSLSDIQATGGGQRTFQNKTGLTSIYQIRQFPYYVAVMHTRQNSLHQWYRETKRDVAIIVVTTIIALMALGMAHRQSKRRKAVERQLQDHQLNLENMIQQRTEELDKSNASLSQKNEALEDALKEIKTLKGILPICSFCKNIRDDKGYWEKVEVYVQRHSQADFSHSICPDCARKHYPELNLFDDEAPEES